MKKQIIAALCIAAAAAATTGCSGKSSDTASAKDLKSAEKRIEALEAQLEELSGEVEDNEDGEYEFDEEIHEVYDDTAVVEAYKSGDDSALTDEKDKYIYEELKKAVDEIINDDMTDYEKELAVYTYVFNGTKFDQSSLSAIDTSSEYSHTPYGFFHDHTTICVGNATTFKLFMDVLGIDCEIIHSTTQGEHAWNVVKIDGDWYQVDITFDSGTGSDGPAYDYLNVTDAVKQNDGYPWDPADYHECTSTKYNYGVLNAVECDDVYDIPEKLKALYDDAQTTHGYYKFDIPDGVDPTVYKAQIQCLFENITTEDDTLVYGSIPILTDDEKSVVVGVTVQSANDLYGSTGDVDAELMESRADIDYSKLSDEFSSVFDGKVSIVGDLTAYEQSYLYTQYSSDDVTSDSAVTTADSTDSAADGEEVSLSAVEATE
jgi:hypothetical protein